MAASSSKKREPRAAVEDLAEGTSSRSKFDAVSQVILSPFTRGKNGNSNRLLSDCAYNVSTSYSVETNKYTFQKWPP